MQKDSLTSDERLSLEESIMDAHMAADKLLSSGKEVHHRLLDLTVKDALEYITKYKKKLKNDKKAENYKLHMLVPLQLHLMLDQDKDNKDGEET
tara:strand:+ start:27379 stop:27660 length:282 start_codon:yes stop_codon:yes gene_type:complete